MAPRAPSPAPPPLLGLEPEAQAAVRAAARRLSARPGQVLFREGEPASSLFLVESGRVKLAQLTEGGQEVIVRLSGPGELFAAVAALDGRDYPFTATASEPSLLLAWDRRTLADLFRRHPGFEAGVLRIVGAHSRESLDRLRQLATEPVPQRLARVLLRLAGPGGDGVEVAGVTQQELAEMAGTTLYTVSRTLSEWAQRGVARAGRGRVVVDSMAGLRALAEGEEPRPRR